jgi:hypothetical protein
MHCWLLLRFKWGVRVRKLTHIATVLMALWRTKHAQSFSVSCVSLFSKKKGFGVEMHFSIHLKPPPTSHHYGTQVTFLFGRCVRLTSLVNGSWVLTRSVQTLWDWKHSRFVCRVLANNSMVFLSGIESPFLRCFNQIYVNCFKWLQQSDCISHSIPMNHSLNHHQTSIFLTVKWTISMSGPRIWNLPSQHRWVNGLDEPMATHFFGAPSGDFGQRRHGDFMGLNQHKRLLDRIETTEMVIWWDIF